MVSSSEAAMPLQMSSRRGVYKPKVKSGQTLLVLMLSVCAPLVVFFDAFLVITSASFLSGFVT